MTPPRRIALLSDFPEEQWPSMDRCFKMLHDGLRRDHADFESSGVCPPFKHRLGFASRNSDRLLNRLWRYPRHAARISHRFDLFHVVDHSYSQLIHKLPADRTGVFCHDLDTFRCVLDPAAEPRPRWFRAMVKHILRGFRKAGVVFFATRAVEAQILRHGLIEPSKLVHAPLGVSPAFTVATGPAAGNYILHVGSTIARKRIDVVLDAFALLQSQNRSLRLMQVGGSWTEAQTAQIGRLGIGDSITQIRGIDEAELAKVYRGARVVLQTSDAEGFGLPVAEALACGAPVVASDIPVLREVGGDAALYAPVGDVHAFAEAARRALDASQDVPVIEDRIKQAARFSWESHCRIIADAYRRLHDR